MYKGLLNRESLRVMEDVKYDRNTLRPHLTDKSHIVFLWINDFEAYERRSDGQSVDVNSVKNNDEISTLSTSSRGETALNSAAPKIRNK